MYCAAERNTCYPSALPGPPKSVSIRVTSATKLGVAVTPADSAADDGVTQYKITVANLYTAALKWSSTSTAGWSIPGGQSNTVDLLDGGSAGSLVWTEPVEALRWVARVEVMSDKTWVTPGFSMNPVNIGICRNPSAGEAKTIFDDVGVEV